MAYILYDPISKHVETGQRLYAAKNGTTTDRCSEAQLFESMESAKNAANGPFEGYVAANVLQAQIRIMLIEAIRRTWDVLEKQALESSEKTTMSAREVRTYLWNYIENDAVGSHSKSQWWDPLSDADKTSLLADAIPDDYFEAGEKTN